jgi:hypothetical protein
MHFKSFNILGKNRDKRDKSNDGSKNANLNPVDGMEGQLSDRTRDLARTEQQLRELASKATAPEATLDARPHGPIGELIVETGAEAGEPVVELVVQKVSAKSKPETSEDSIKLTELKTPAELGQLKVQSVTGQPKDQPAAEKPKEAAKVEDDSLRGLFGQDEEEANPLTSLIGSLPDVNTQELLDDIQEINEIIKETRQNE